MAITEPITGIQYGTVLGKFIASSIPVTTALKSPIVLREWVALQYNHSLKTAAATDNARMSAER